MPVLAIVFIMLLALIALASLLSSAETSVTAVSKAKLHSLAKKGDPKAKLVLELQKNVGLSLSTILLFNTLCLTIVNNNIGDIAADLFGKEAIIFASFAMTIIITVYAETLPKIIAVNSPEKVLMLLIRPLWVVFRVFRPITLAINNFARAHLRLFGIKSNANDEFAALEELRGAIDMHFAHEKPDANNERAMLKSILDLREVSVGEIMTHRKNVTMVNANDAPSEIVKQVLESPFTRVPLYKNDTDNIVGIIHSKALLRYVNAHQDSLDKLDIVSVAAAPWFIPETADLIEQLQAFKNRREHFAIVVDEYGAFNGIVTLEDILEEIVGDITDEHDIAVRGIRPQEDGSFIIDGTVTIRDVNRQLNWELPDEEASTMAGLVLYEIRAIPEVGQSFNIHGYHFEILRRHRNQITLLKIKSITSQN
ncbi:HlyC/CorC family transporter [Candidatus Odyssella acanthamoebae]|uniref:Membrane protein n=1 Tax=Candidatus Odyssella acanthamoebae TaxID=91604 RepID=A0A077AUA0_9PROT|nr:CNNM domain-containing protein [Candidatus Paracaedibacter acanthamoebae]AIK95599.1 membrane protein [Candidatus Paracaedibacter acanthamoebae]